MLLLAVVCKRTLEIKGDKTMGWSTGWRVKTRPGESKRIKR